MKIGVIGCGWALDLYQPVSGRPHQAVAGAMGRVYFVAAGLPVSLKGGGPVDL